MKAPKDRFLPILKRKIYVFFRKLKCRTYSFSWLYFDKIKSQKRCEELLSHYKKGRFRLYCLIIYPVVECRIIHPAFWLCQFYPLFTSVLGCDIVGFRPWNGQYHVLKWCILYDRKNRIAYKSLVFSILRKVLISRVFASDGESVRKYSLIFGGRIENSG